MFRRRAGARYLKTLSPYDRILGHIMPKRSDAMVFFEDDINCKYLDDYIAEKKAQGIEMNYLDIFVAATVRLYALRPALNRFTMNGRVFANQDISISMAVKKSLRDNVTDTTIKLHFTGHENIFEIRDRFEGEIYKNKGADTSNGTDKTAKLLTCVPNFLIKFAMGLIRLLDRLNLLPRALLDVSPFHASGFITYLKSIGIPAIYHHIYDLGTIGQFIAVGKEQMKVVVDRKTGELVPAKILTVKIVADERICDGLYYARSFRLFRRIMENPAVLEQTLETVEKDIG